MKILIVTKHIGVLDLKWCYEKLRHEVTIRSYSFHSYIVGLPQIPVDYDAAKLLDRTYCSQWWESHPEVHGYDVYVSFYEPMSITLFRDSGAKLVMVCPIRPFFPFEGKISQALDELRSLPNLKVIANGLYDKAYFDHYAQRGGMPIAYIPSLCKYLPVPKWSGEHAEDWILETRGTRLGNLELPGTTHLPAGYSWRSLYSDYRGFIEIGPRQVNTMSFFEKYCQGMPMAYPSVSALRKLQSQGLALSELHFCGPSEYEGGKYPDIDIGLSDYYQWPHIQLWDSMGDLADIVNFSDEALATVSNAMLAHHDLTTQFTLDNWKQVLS